MQKIIDLDASGVLADTVIARIRGNDYTLPGDIPATLFVRLSAVQGQSEQDALVQLHDEILAVFQVHQPDLQRLPLGLTELSVALGQIYGRPAASDPNADDDDELDPTTPAKKKPARRRSTSST